MFKISPRRSTTVVNVMIAIVITLTVNFSYLISMIVEQREGSEQQQMREQTERRKPECNGILHISRDGYGYLLSQTNFSPEYPDSVRVDSVYVRSQTIRFYNLQNRDTLLCTLNPPMRGSNPSVAEVLKQNGAEISAPVIYDRPKRDREMAVQLLYYLGLSFLLLTIMTIKFDVHNFTFRRYMLRCTTVVIATLILYFFAPFADWRTGKMMMILQHPRTLLDLMVVLKCTVVLTVAILYGRIYGMLFEQQKILLENEQLRNENLQTRYNMLLGQISPHFFFNSLNSLSTLVRENDTRAALTYIDQLSYTFRYVLQNSQNMEVPLAEELHFVEAYGYQFKIRYADKLFFDINIDKHYLDYTLPSLSLQPLIDNAVKHNAITSRRPLHVEIRTEEDKLVVSNQKSPLVEPAQGTGIGLKNLNSRYELITGESIEIIETEDIFTVKLPLQKPQTR